MSKKLVRKWVACSAVFLVLAGCSQEQTKRKPLDGKVLLEAKCASCHNLEMPPQTSPDEPAPPMMAVAFHVYDFIEAGTPAEKTPASIAFVKDYVINPAVDKSFCDKKSLEDYGLMPSQKGKVTADELEAIAIYMFAHYNQQNYFNVIKERQILRQMEPGERLARQKGCLSCHGMIEKKMGPSFRAIAMRYAGNKQQVKERITTGSQNRWPEARRAKMPAFKQLTNEELGIVSAWILQQ